MPLATCNFSKGILAAGLLEALESDKTERTIKFHFYGLSDDIFKQNHINLFFSFPHLFLYFSSVIKIQKIFVFSN